MIDRYVVEFALEILAVPVAQDQVGRSGIEIVVANGSGAFKLPVDVQLAGVLIGRGVVTASNILLSDIHKRIGQSCFDGYEWLVKDHTNLSRRSKTWPRLSTTP